MIGYVCKYTPVEILEAMDADPIRVEAKVTNFNQADVLMHPNVCSYVKSVLEDMTHKDYEGIVLTTCCDSIRRLYDTLKATYPDKFFYLLDVPRKVNEFSTGLYQKRVLEMAKAYAKFSGKEFKEERLRELLIRQEEKAKIKEAPKNPDGLRIGLIGARYSKGIRNLLEDNNVQIAYDLTCIGLKREFHVDENLMFSYASQLLEQIPCMRMIDAVNREHYIEGFSNEIDGILYHTIKFCDNYSYEYAELHQTSDLPILKVETDATMQCEGQIKTRVEAFLESLRIARGLKITDLKARIKENQDMYILGVDSGSTSTNAVILNDKKEMLASVILRTGAKSGESAERIRSMVIEKAGLKEEDITLTVSTGYGRVSIPYADMSVTEISCHGKGARYFFPNVHTILDIGGQDSKAIRLNDEGEVVDFVMNDKCAAGTGRFLEAMARTLEIDISELGPISMESTKAVEISSMCTVFAESEVISLIAQNTEKADIANGVHNSIAGKAFSLLKRVGLEGEFMMTGGVARNPGVVKAVEEKLGSKLCICKEPDIVGATGAALFGLENLNK